MILRRVVTLEFTDPPSDADLPRRAALESTMNKAISVIDGCECLVVCPGYSIDALARMRVVMKPMRGR